MKDRIDFGDIGIKIYDEIYFIPKPSISFIVASGDGTPGNGGTLLKYKDGRDGLYSIRYITRKLLGKKFSDEQDVYSLWTFHGKSLRGIYIKKMIDNV